MVRAQGGGQALFFLRLRSGLVNNTNFVSFFYAAVGEGVLKALKAAEKP